MKRARPPHLDAWRLTRSVLRIAALLSFVVLGAIGVLRPSRFGSQGSKPFGNVEWWVLAAVVGMCLLIAFTRATKIRRTVHRILEPFRHPLEDVPSFEPAASALGSCPAAFQTRFAMGWVWGPAAAVVLGTFFTASAVYFVIDAVLARFQIGWQQPILAVANLVLAVTMVRLVAKRLAVWRLALSVHRSVSGRYDS